MESLNLIDLGALIASLFALSFANKANKTAENAKEVSERANEIQLEIAKRNGVIELHHAWEGVETIRLPDYNVYSVTKALNALSLTSSLINHDVMKIEIIYDQYWLSFKELYLTIQKIKEPHPELSFIPAQRITPDIQKAFKKLERIEIIKSKRHEQ